MYCHVLPCIAMYCHVLPLMVMYSAWSILTTKVVRQCLSIVRVNVFEYLNHIATGSSIYECRQIKYLESFLIIKMAKPSTSLVVLFCTFSKMLICFFRRGDHTASVGSYKCCVQLFKQLAIEKGKCSSDQTYNRIRLLNFC